jgi:hypothetical protein
MRHCRLKLPPRQIESVYGGIQSLNEPHALDFHQGIEGPIRITVPFIGKKLDYGDVSRISVSGSNFWLALK